MRLLSWNVLESSTTFSSVHTKISQKVTQLHVNKGINTFLWELLSAAWGEVFTWIPVPHHSHAKVEGMCTSFPWVCTEPRRSSPDNSAPLWCPAPFSCPQPFSTVLSLLSLNKPLLKNVIWVKEGQRRREHYQEFFQEVGRENPHLNLCYRKGTTRAEPHWKVLSDICHSHGMSSVVTEWSMKINLDNKNIK